MSEPAPARRLRLVSYNVHRCIGLDGRKDIGRVASVLEEMDADVIALQEAEALTREGRVNCQIEALAARLGMEPLHGPTIVTHQGRYGNGLLTRHAIRDVIRLDLSHRRREPRGALIVRMDGEAAGLGLACTHLGLRSGERASQVRAILERMPPSTVSVLLGDLNEWLPVSRLLRSLASRFGPMPRPATFPALHPLLALDRAYVAPRTALVSAKAHRSPASRRASDHLPLVIVVDVPAP